MSRNTNLANITTLSKQYPDIHNPSIDYADIPLLKRERLFNRELTYPLGDFYLSIDSNIPRIIEVGDIGFDTEYKPATESANGFYPQQPVIFSLSYQVEVLPYPFNQMEPKSVYEQSWVYHSLNIPGCDYIFVTPASDMYQKMEVKGYVIKFGFDARGIEAYKPFRDYFNLCLHNIFAATGLTPIRNRISSENDQRNTTLWTTLSDAELALFFPDKASTTKYFKGIKNVWVGEDILKQNRPQYKNLRGTTVLYNYWVSLDNEVVCIDFKDTKLFNGFSVDGIAESLGTKKYGDFDFTQNDANHYYNQDPLKFHYYCGYDSAISLGITHIIETYLSVFDICETQGLINHWYYEHRKDPDYNLSFKDLARKKQTLPGIAEVLVFAFMRKQGYFDAKSGITPDKSKGIFVDNKKFIQDNFTKDELKIKGGNNNRLTDTMLMEVFHNVDQYDAKSMYPSVCKLLKFPIYEPVGFGYQRITASKLLENLEEYDWFTLTVSFEFPKDSPTIKRQFIQHQNGKTHCYRKVNHQILRPPELELIVDEHPDIEIKVHKGWIWDRNELEDLIEKGKLSGKPDDYYLDLSELFGTLMNEREKHKKAGNDLQEKAIKLLKNVGSYGKFAQCKEVPDSEALEETMLNDGDFSSIANNAVSESVVTHPEFANAITACARSLNALIAKEHDAKLSVTDSVLTANNTSINLDNCKKGFKWLDKLVEGSKYENETDDNTYLAIICGKRGKTLIPQNEELVGLLKNLDNQEKLDRAKSIVTDLAQQMEEKIIKVPKFAKDGIKYEGNQARQWEQCSHDCLDRLYGKTLKKTIKHLLKRNEVLKGQTHYKMVNMAIHKPRVLDCVDFGSYPYEDYEQHVQMENTKQKLKGADKPKMDGKGNIKEEGKPYSTAGQAYRFHNEEFWARFEKAKPRSLPTQKYNADDIRLFVIFADLGLLADSEIAKQLGCSRQAIANQRKKLTAGQTYHYWFQKQLADLVNLKGVRDICQNCKIDAVTALQRSSVWEDMDDMSRKKADKILNGLMTRLENRYGVRLVRKSKRAKKLKMEKVA